MSRTRMFGGFGSNFWKRGTAMEVFRFALYLIAPVAASVIYANPAVMHDIIRQLKLVEYPEAAKPPPVGEEINKHRLSQMMKDQQKQK